MNSGEKLNSSIEPGEKNKWSELEELTQGDFAGDSKNETIEIETPEEREMKMSEALAMVKESYKKSNTEDLTLL